MKLLFTILATFLSLCLYAAEFEVPKPTPVTPERLDELVMLNGIGGWGDIGKMSASREIKAPNSKFGFSIKFDFEDKPGGAWFWSITNPLPPDTDLRKAKSVSFDVYVEKAEGGAQLALHLQDCDRDRYIVWESPLEKLPTNTWQHIEVSRDSMRQWTLGDGEIKWENLSNLAIEPSKGKAVFYLDNVRLNGADGYSSYILSTGDDGLLCDPEWRATKIPENPPGYVYLSHCSQPSYLFELFDGKLGVPVVGFDPGIVDKMNRLRKLGINGCYYGDPAVGFARYITRRQGWDMNAHGRSLNHLSASESGWDIMHTAAMGHSSVIGAFKLTADALIKAGISKWFISDYTFPWFETWWGYSPAVIDCFRKDLAGNDPGVVITSGASEKRIHFPDYVKMYSGWYPSPADLGLKEWSQYNPPMPEDLSVDAHKRRVLFFYLRNYEWLRLADVAGRYYQSKGGSGLSIIPNPEDVSTSVDYIAFLRCRGSYNLLPEWFGNIGDVSEALFASGRYLKEQSVKSGCRISTAHESGATGHASPYLEWQVAYNGIYSISASCGLDDFDNDFLDDSPRFDLIVKEPEKNAVTFGRFRDTVVKGWAFLEARKQNPRKPKADILCVGDRSVGRWASSFFHTTQGPFTMTHGLSRSHFCFDQRDQFELEAALKGYKVIFFNPWCPKDGILEKLRIWLTGKAGRILVVNSFVPTRKQSEFWGGLDRTTKLGKAQGWKHLGLGKITTTEHRSATVISAKGVWGRYFKKGDTIELSEPLTFCRNAESLVITDKGPLVSRAWVGKSSVVYLHYTPNGPETTRAIDVRVAKAVAEMAALRPLVTADEDTVAQVFDIPGGKSVLLWDGPSLRKWEFRYEPGISPLKYAASDVDRTARIDAGKTALVYDFWNDTLKAVSADKNGQVPLMLKGRLTALFYVGTDSPEFNTAVQRARSLRKRMKALNFEKELGPEAGG